MWSLSKIESETLMMNNRGQSLVQTLISVGLVAILATVLAQVMVDQNRQLRAIESKQEVIELRNLLTMTLMNSAGCCPIGNSAIADYTIQEGSAADIIVSSIFSFCANAVNPTPPKLFQTGNDADFQYFRVRGVSLINVIRPDPVGAPSQYKASLKVSIENKDSHARALPDLLFPVSFATSKIATEPILSQKRQVSSCSTVDSTGVSSLGSTGVPLGMEVYKNAGTYSFKVPDGVTRLKVELWGGGGGGEIVNSPGYNSSEKSGGAGGYSADIFDVTPGAQYSVVVGKGGWQTFGSLKSKDNGGNTSFGNLLVAEGGKSGKGSADGGAGSGRLGINGNSGSTVKTEWSSSSDGYYCVYVEGGTSPNSFRAWGSGGGVCNSTVEAQTGQDGRAIITW